jgi:hypothetical protein
MAQLVATGYDKGLNKFPPADRFPPMTSVFSISYYGFACLTRVPGNTFLFNRT